MSAIIRRDFNQTYNTGKGWTNNPSNAHQFATVEEAKKALCWKDGHTILYDPQARNWPPSLPGNPGPNSTIQLIRFEATPVAGKSPHGSESALPVLSLTVHPALDGMPSWSDDDPQFEALCLDMSRRGLDYKIKVDSQNRITDGRHRVRGAKKLGWESIPVERVPDDQVTSIIISTLLQRRHYSKGALAYMLVPVLNGNGRNQERFAEEQGISGRLFRQALELRKIFADSPEGAEYQAEIEPQILAGECGLGACIAGWAGRLATKGKAKNINSQLELWDRAWTSLENRFTYWSAFDDAAKLAAAAKLSAVVEKLPTDLLQKFQRLITDESKRRKE